MKTYDLTGNVRKETGKKSTKNLRKEKRVPCVLYGGKEIVHFSAFENDFQNLLHTTNVYIVNLELDGKNFKAILQDFQFHPVTDKIMHADFIEVFDDKKVIIKIPIHLTGSSEGIKEGGKLRQRRRHLKVKGLPKDMPDHLDIDIADMNIGDVKKIGDLLYDNLELLDPQRAMREAPEEIAAAEEAAAEEAAAEEAAAEGAPAEEGVAKEGVAKEGNKKEGDQTGKEG